MKLVTYLTFCFILLPISAATAEDKSDNAGPFVEYNTSLDPEAAAAFSAAVRSHASGDTIPAEIAQAQMRLSRRVALLTAEAAQNIKKRTIPAASRKIQEAPNGAALAQKLERDLTGLAINPGPSEYEVFTRSIEKAGGSLNATAAAGNLQSEAASIRTRVARAVKEEMADTIEALEETSAPQPGSEAPK